MVRQRVLDIFAGLYAGGGAELDLAAQAGAADATGAAAERPASLADRLARWYVRRRQRRQA